MQCVSNMMLNTSFAPKAIPNKETEVEDDLLSKLTGRLEQVFESARQLKAQSGRLGGELKSGRFNTRFGLSSNMAAIDEELNNFNGTMTFQDKDNHS